MTRGQAVAVSCARTQATAAASSEVAPRLRLAVARLSRKLRRLSAGGLTLTQLSALASLESLGQLRLGDLAAHEGVSPPTLSRIVAPLERDGYLDRMCDPDDRRSSLVSLSPAGHAMLVQVRKERTAALEAAVDAMASDERAILTAVLPVLEQLVDALEVSPSRALGTSPTIHPATDG